VFTLPDPETVDALRDEAMGQVEAHAGIPFAEQAVVFIFDYLVNHGPTSGEVLTIACKQAGIVPHDDRAFGPVYMRLSRAGLIVKQGSIRRERGHGTSGGNIWALAE
jgi:hypothetical protein